MDSIVIPAEGATNEFNFSCISMKRAILRWLCIHHGECEPAGGISMDMTELYRDYAPDCVYHTPLSHSSSTPLGAVFLTLELLPLRRAVISNWLYDV